MGGEDETRTNRERRLNIAISGAKERYQTYIGRIGLRLQM